MSMSTNAVAVIPARGGSKGVKDKNLRVVAGETLLEQAIRKCHEAGVAPVVSSESERIGRHAEANSATWIQRPARLAQDDSTTLATLRHAWGFYPEVERMLLVQCTAPTMTAGDIAACLESRTADLAVCCHPFHGFVIDDGGNSVNVKLGEGDVPRRQELPRQWVISGSVWGFHPSYLYRVWYRGSVQPIESEDPFRVEIDEESDLAIAEAYLERKRKVALEG